MWKFEVLKDDVGGWRWRLVLRNTLIVVESSESFDKRCDAKTAAAAARALIAASPVDVV